MIRSGHAIAGKANMEGKSQRKAFGLCMFCAFEVVALLLSPIVNILSSEPSPPADLDMVTNKKSDNTDPSQPSENADENNDDDEEDDDDDDDNSSDGSDYEGSDYDYDSDLEIRFALKRQISEMKAEYEALKTRNDECERLVRLATIPQNQLSIPELHHQIAMLDAARANAAYLLQVYARRTFTAPRFPGV